MQELNANQNLLNAPRKTPGYNLFSTLAKRDKRNFKIR
jgi:hypothetical protein